MNSTQKVIVTISYTVAGAELQEKVAAAVEHTTPGCEVLKYAYKKEERTFAKTEDILDQYFVSAQMILFISAAGIAVRKIAPYLKSKTTDPAVLCMDEAGRFVIPLVSGHLGGANAWAKQIADRIGAQAVITTATDVQGAFAVDLFAKRNGLRIEDSTKIKEVSARILAGERVGLTTVFLIEGELPEGLQRCAFVNDQTDSVRPECGITITEDPDLTKQFAVECRLLAEPKNLYLGMGCRRGKEADALEAFVRETLKQNGLELEKICGVASVDKKSDEAGLIELAECLRIPFVTYDAETLMTMKGDFSASAFVESQVGVDNVCERAAVCAAGEHAELLLHKTAQDGMTLAVAKRNTVLHFAEENKE